MTHNKKPVDNIEKIANLTQEYTTLQDKIKNFESMEEPSFNVKDLSLQNSLMIDYGYTTIDQAIAQELLLFLIDFHKKELKEVVYTLATLGIHNE